MLKNLTSKFSRQPNPDGHARPGLYHYSLEQNGEKSRVHLRIDPDGHGTLIVNAAHIFHFNPTAAWMAYAILEGQDPVQLTASLRKSFRIDQNTARQDATGFTRQLDELIFPNGSCPICDMDLDVTAPFSTVPSAPYRMDLAVTYRCNNDCAHCYNARARDYPELDTGQWKRILDQLWASGIPHIVFTGGEPTLREDLPELIAHAEANGQITGINTNGRSLADPAYLALLVNAGLDHVQITLESHLPEIHDRMVKARGAWQQTTRGLENALSSRLYVMTNTTLLQDNSPELEGTLAYLQKMGVPTVGLNALIYSGKGARVNTGIHESELPPLLEIARRLTKENDQRLIWYTPTQYCHFDPMLLELGVKGCTAARYNMCVEPDGSVIPCQSYYSTLGNLLLEPWDAIWNHKLAVSLREHQDIPPLCTSCSLLSECGGGCPLAREAGAILPMQYQPVL